MTSTNPRSIDQAVVVHVPSRPELLHVLRAVAASVAGRLDFPYDAVDDLRLAVDEACSQVISVRGPSSRLRMRVREGSDEVEIDVGVDAPARSWPPEGLQRTLAWQILSALADEASFGTDGAQPTISLLKRVPR